MKYLAEEILMEFVHKGHLWAIKLYLVLRKKDKERGHRTLVKLRKTHGFSF